MTTKQNLLLPICALTVAATGCGGPLDADQPGHALETESTAAALKGSETSGTWPVVRIKMTAGASSGNCTATAITPDLLVTAAHCVKTGRTMASSVKVTVAHGLNSSAKGKSARLIILPRDIRDNVDVQLTMPVTYGLRDIAFLKFDPETFASFFPLHRVDRELDGEWARLVGFGGDQQKHYADVTVWHHRGPYPSAEVYSDFSYAEVFPYYDESLDLTESGDSGGPLLVSANGRLEVAGVLFGGNGLYPTFNTRIYDAIAEAITQGHGCIAAYEHFDFGGQGFSICDGDVVESALRKKALTDPFVVHGLSNQWGEWNDKLSSMRVPAGTVVTMWEHGIGIGRHFTLDAAYEKRAQRVLLRFSDVGLNDVVSEFEILRPDAQQLTWNIQSHGTGKCLEIGGYPVAGAPVEQQACNRWLVGQYWRLDLVETVGDTTYYRLFNPASGLCVEAGDVAGGQPGVVNFSPLRVQACRTTENQQFAVEANSATGVPGDLKLISRRGSRKCIDVPYGQGTNGLAMHMYDCLDHVRGAHWFLTLPQ